jgi:DNA-binding NarL/FixJ family response regulator
MAAMARPIRSEEREATMFVDGETSHKPGNEIPRIRIFCVDDHPLLRNGIRVMVNNEPDMVLIAEACNGRDAIELFRREHPDVTLMDLRLPGMSGVDATIAIRAEFPGARIIMLTTFEGDAEIQRALRAGVFAFMLKTMPPDEMVQTIRRVYAGKRCVLPEIAALLAEHYSEDSLTTREIEVLRQIANGNRNRDIAQTLFISEQTVKAHVSHILEKLGASDRAEAVVIGTRRGIIQL